MAVTEDLVVERSDATTRGPLRYAVAVAGSFSVDRSLRFHHLTFEPNPAQLLDLTRQILDVTKAVHAYAEARATPPPSGPG